MQRIPSTVVPRLVALNHRKLYWPGIASLATLRLGIVKEWSTSTDVMLSTMIVLTGTTRLWNAVYPLG